MKADVFDLHRSAIEIPREFWDVRYSAQHFPGAPGICGVEGGANCQQYAYSILRHFGFEILDLRSSDLWEDAVHTAVTNKMKPFDLVLVHRNQESFGAHVGLCVGQDLVLHLSKNIDSPAIETLAGMQRRAEYNYLIGFKTVLVRH